MVYGFENAILGLGSRFRRAILGLMVLRSRFQILTTGFWEPDTKIDWQNFVWILINFWSQNSFCRDVVRFFPCISWNNRTFSLWNVSSTAGCVAAIVTRTLSIAMPSLAGVRSPGKTTKNWNWTIKLFFKKIKNLHNNLKTWTKLFLKKKHFAQPKIARRVTPCNTLASSASVTAW